MTEEKKVTNRRAYIGAAGAGVAGLAVGAGAGWYLGSQQQPVAPECKPEDVCPAAGYLKESDVPARCETLGYVRPPTQSELTFWDYTWDEPFFMPVLELYKELHPEVNFVGTDWLEYVGYQDKLLIACQSSNPPDILAITPSAANSFAEIGGLLTKLDDFVQTELGSTLDAELDIDRFYEVEWEICRTQDGHISTIPYRGSGGVAYWYHKDMFAEAGVEAKLYYSWSEFIELCEQLNDPPNQYALHFGWGDPNRGYVQPMYFMWSTGGGILEPNTYKTDPKLYLTSPESIKGFSFVTETLKPYYPESVVTDIDVDQRTFLATKKAACIIDGLYIPTIVAGLGMDVGKLGLFFVPWPDDKINNPPDVPPSTPNIAATGGWAFAIPEKSNNKKVAWDLIKYFMKDVINVYIERTTTPLKSTVDHYRYRNAQWDKYFLESITYGSDMDLYVPKYNEVVTIMQTATQQVVTGMSDPESALTEAQDEISAITGIPIYS